MRLEAGGVNEEKKSRKKSSKEILESTHNTIEHKQCRMKERSTLERRIMNEAQRTYLVKQRYLRSRENTLENYCVYNIET